MFVFAILASKLETKNTTTGHYIAVNDNDGGKDIGDCSIYIVH
jgi:hypothetical protein